MCIRDRTNIEIEFDEFDLSLDLELSKAEFEAIVASKFEESFQLTHKLIQENNPKFSDIERIILVGGTTYIPYIRQELEKRSQTLVDSSIDPTTAVVLGASFYAGSRPSEYVESEKEVVIEQETLSVELIFEPHSKDKEELIVAILPTNFNGFYRITRSDGGFDTGLLAANKKITEFVPLLEKATNIFSLFLLSLIHI